MLLSVLQELFGMILGIGLGWSFAYIAYKYKIRYPKPKKIATTRTMVSVCCDAPMQLQQVGAEMYCVCSLCDKYIGHLVPREIALLYTCYQDYILQALKDRQIASVSEKELDELHDLYLKWLTNFAGQAARKAVSDLIPAE